MARILVVDDNSTNRQLLVRLLGYYSHSLVEAVDGVAALEALERNRFDLVISDVLMPRMDGFELARRIQAAGWTHPPRVIFSTAIYQVAQIEELAREVGVHHILGKPARPQEILALVSKVLGEPERALESPVVEPASESTHLASRLSGRLDTIGMKLAALLDYQLELSPRLSQSETLKKSCHAARNLIGARRALAVAAQKSGVRSGATVSEGFDDLDANWSDSHSPGPEQLTVLMKGRPTHRVSRENESGAGLPMEWANRPILVATIASPTTVHGWLILLDKLGASEFTEEDERLLGILAALEGRVHDNTVLTDQLQERGYELEAEEGERRLAERDRDHFFQRSPNLQAICGFDGHYHRLNPAWEATLGFSEEQLMREPFALRLHPEDASATEAEVAKLAAGGITAAFEMRLQCRDGSYKWFLWVATPLNDREFFVSGQEITKHIESELALKSRLRQQAAVAYLGQFALAEQNRLVVLERAVKIVSSTLDVQHVTVLKPTSENELLLKASVGWESAVIGQTTIPGGALSQAGYTLLKNVPVTMNDLETERRFGPSQLLRNLGMVSGITVPIGGREKPYGVLCAHTTQRRAFTQDDVNFLVAIASTLASAIERDDAQQRLHEQSRLSALSAEVGHSLTRGDSLRDMLAQCAQAMVTHLDAAVAEFWTLDEAKQALELQASAGLPTRIDQRPPHIPVGQSTIGAIAQDLHSYLTDDLTTYSDVDDPAWARREGVTSFAGYPLVLDNRLVGVMTMFARHRLSQATLDAMSAVANPIATGIERKRTEQRLRLTQFTIQHVATGVFWVDEHARFFDVNEAACRMTGYPREELLGLTVHDIDPHVTRDVWQQLWPSMRQRKSVALESEHRRKDGSLTPVMVNTNFLCVDGREYSCTFVQNIAERKRTERRTNAQQAITRLLASATSLKPIVAEMLQIICESLEWDVGSLWCVTPSADRIACAGSWTSLSGPLAVIAAALASQPLERGECIPGRAWDRREPIFFSDVGREHESADILMAREAGLELAGAFPISLGGNAIGVLSFLTRQAPAPDEGVRLMMAAIGSQIAQFIDRQRGIESIREMGETLQSLIEASPLAIVTLDGNAHVQRWNPAAEKIFGWTADEAVGQFYPLVAEGDRPKFEADYRSRFMCQSLRGVEVQHLRKDGGFVDVALWTSPLRNSQGETTALMALLADVSEKKRLEEQYRQSQKMEAVGRLAGGVAHDFNNLLTVINGYADMLLEELTSDDPSRDLVEEIHRSGERAAGLTRQLLAFSRRQMLVPVVLDLNAQLDEMEKLLRRLIGEDIDLLVRKAPDLWRIESDPGQIEQVVMNLVINARDAMPRGGKLTIQTRNISLDETYVASHPETRRGEYVMVSIEDSGCGMDAATKTRIFEPFFTTKEKGKGTGLGLATVYGIVHQSDGHIEVYSEPGLGTSFKIYLPRCVHSADAEVAAASGGEDRGGSEVILLVEDEPGVRSLTRSVLESRGYRVLAAPNGTDAIITAGEYAGTIDLLVTDVVMPGMSGPELASRLTTGQPGLRALFLSGYTDEAVVHHGILGTENAFLQKPFKPTSLALKVREVLDAATPRGAANAI